MGFTRNSIKYLERISNESIKVRRSDTIERSIAEKDYWDEVIEWRIMTETMMRIEPVVKKGKNWYRVSVSCGQEMVCHCPTLDRAIQFLGIYERLIRDLFWTVGWPSWASPTKLEP